MSMVRQKPDATRSPGTPRPGLALVHVVEDDTTMRSTLTVLLNEAGMNVTSFRSAEDFLDHTEFSEPVCLLSDVRLPGMSGLALYKELVRRDVAAVVVMITGDADVPMAVEALKAGVMDFIEKPFAPELLVST